MLPPRSVQLFVSSPYFVQITNKIRKCPALRSASPIVYARSLVDE